MPEGSGGIFRIRSEGREWLATESMAPGRQAYKERLVSRGGVEYRLWDPYKSKLAAAILNGLAGQPIVPGSSVLYLGASAGTTVSHVSDIVGPRGTVFAVEHASRVARDFLERVASHRRNIVPVMQDARRPGDYFSVFGRADVVYSDIAQPDQTAIAMSNCRAWLRGGGRLMMVIKASSIDATRPAARVIGEEVERLRGGLEVEQTIDLMPYDRNHAMAVARMPGG